MRKLNEKMSLILVASNLYLNFNLICAISRVKYYSIYFTTMSSLNLHNNPMEKPMQKLNMFSRVTRPINGGSRIETQEAES